MTYHERVQQAKRDIITAALREHSGNRAHAAKALGLQRTYLFRMINDLGVQVPPGRTPPRGKTVGPTHRAQKDPALP